MLARKKEKERIIIKGKMFFFIFLFLKLRDTYVLYILAHKLKKYILLFFSNEMFREN